MTAEPDTLERSPFFECFQPKHLEKLSALASRLHFTQDQVIFREDNDSSQFYVILSGRVALEVEADGRKVLIQTLYAGDELGWSAMLNRTKQFQARALEPVELLCFEVSPLRDACDSNPYFARAFFERLLAVVAERLQSTRLQLAAEVAEARRKASAPARD